MAALRLFFFAALTHARDLIGATAGFPLHNVFVHFDDARRNFLDGVDDRDFAALWHLPALALLTSWPFARLRSADRALSRLWTLGSRAFHRRSGSCRAALFRRRSRCRRTALLGF